MNLTGLKELIKKFGAVVIMNGTEPEFVIMPYSHYTALEAGTLKPSSISRPASGMKPLFPNTQENQAHNSTGEEQVDEERIVEMLNKEIMALKEELLQREAAAENETTENA